MRRATIAVVLGSALLLGCGRDGGVVVDGSANDLSVVLAADMAAPDLALPSDLAVPDLATPDLQTPDLQMPDLEMPDLQTPDLRMPDLQMPDLQMPDLTPPADFYGIPPKRVFVTSQTYSANLGGLAGADFKCQTLADAAALGGTYKAWLSDSVTGAKDRLTHSDVPYVLVDGTRVADNWTGLTSSTLINGIDRTESNGFTPQANATCSNGGSSIVWTGTMPDGSKFDGVNSACSNWTDDTSSSVALPLGTPGATWAAWTDSGCGGGCFGLIAPLYCFEQ